MYALTILEFDPLRAESLLGKVNACRCAEKLSITVAGSLAELKTLLAHRHRIDIFLADVDTPEGQPSGIDVVAAMQPLKGATQVIYASSYLEDVLDTFRTDHIYFLLSPVDQKLLEAALEKAMEKLDRISPPALSLKVGRKTHLIDPKTILYAESSLRKVLVKTTSGLLESYTKLSDVQRQLPKSFIRCHNSYLANAAFVKTVLKDGLVMADGTTVPISQRRQQETQAAISAFLAPR